MLDYIKKSDSRFSSHVMKHLRSNNPQIQGTERNEICLNPNLSKCDTFEAKGTRLCVNVSSKTKKIKQSSKKAQTPSKKAQTPPKKSSNAPINSTLHIFCYNMTTDNKRQKNNDNWLAFHRNAFQSQISKVVYTVYCILYTVLPKNTHHKTIFVRHITLLWN